MSTTTAIVSLYLLAGACFATAMRVLGHTEHQHDNADSSNPSWNILTFEIMPFVCMMLCWPLVCLVFCLAERGAEENRS